MKGEANMPGLFAYYYYAVMCASYIASRVEIVSFCISIPLSRFLILSSVCFLYRSNYILRQAISFLSILSP